MVNKDFSLDTTKFRNYIRMIHADIFEQLSKVKLLITSKDTKVQV